MTDKYYSIEQVASLLGMHPKTIQRYVREGRLHASKIGKSWRIHGHDLSVFVEGTHGTPPAPAPTTAADRQALRERARASAVFDIPVENPEESMRLINHMNAAFNSKPAEYGQASMSTQFIEPEHAVRIMLWGGLDLMETMTGMLAAYLRGRIGEDGNSGEEEEP
ncbi:MAG: helix-turn-helix domain-containing protein [Clostridia bacterium]|nr:helix-turn-helix domain-containing protein [Clostridia bacterium]